MPNIYKASIDIKDVRIDFKPIFVQFDHAQLEIELTDNGQIYDLSDIERVEFTHVRSDNLVIIQSGEIVINDDGKFIRYEYQGSEMDSLGIVKTSFATFDQSNNKVSSHAFDVAIVKDLRDEIFSPAQPNFGKLQTLIDDVEYLKLYGGGGEGVTIPGPPGPPGSDANVTFENVVSALGYTPANSEDNETIVTAVEQLASAITNIPTGKKFKFETFGLTNNVTVTNLDFKPSFLIIRSVTQDGYTFGMYIYVNPSIEMGTSLMNSYGFIIYANGNYHIPDKTTTITDNGFIHNTPSSLIMKGVWLAVE